MSLIKQVVPWGARTCGPCNACCKTHSVEDTRLTKPIGVWCTHCIKGVGCDIYENRPEMCRVFFCEWIKGIGEERHRPDHTKVVMDYFSLPNSLPGGITQMWELTEGALSNRYAQEATREILAQGIWVSHISLAGRRKKLFVPSGKQLTADIIRSAKEAGMDLCSMGI